MSTPAHPLTTAVHISAGVCLGVIVDLVASWLIYTIIVLFYIRDLLHIAIQLAATFSLMLVEAAVAANYFLLHLLYVASGTRTESGPHTNVTGNLAAAEVHMAFWTNKSVVMVRRRSSSIFEEMAPVTVFLEVPKTPVTSPRKPNTPRQSPRLRPAPRMSPQLRPKSQHPPPDSPPSSKFHAFFDSSSFKRPHRRIRFSTQ